MNICSTVSLILCQTLIAISLINKNFVIILIINVQHLNIYSGFFKDFILYLRREKKEIFLKF